MHYLLRLVPVKLAHNLSFCESRLPSEVGATTARMPRFAPSSRAIWCQPSGNRSRFPHVTRMTSQRDWLAQRLDLENPSMNREQDKSLRKTMSTGKHHVLRPGVQALSGWRAILAGEHGHAIGACEYDGSIITRDGPATSPWRTRRTTTTCSSRCRRCVISRSTGREWRAINGNDRDPCAWLIPKGEG